MKPKIIDEVDGSSTTADCPCMKIPKVRYNYWEQSCVLYWRKEGSSSDGLYNHGNNNATHIPFSSSRAPSGPVTSRRPSSMEPGGHQWHHNTHQIRKGCSINPLHAEENHVSFIDRKTIVHRLQRFHRTHSPIFISKYTPTCMHVRMPILKNLNLHTCWSYRLGFGKSLSFAVWRRA